MRSRYPRETWKGKIRIDTSRRIKRGKQREFPKKKSLTKLKAAILRGRHHKINCRLERRNSLDEGACPLECFTTPESLDEVKQDTFLEDCHLLLGEETLTYIRYLFERCSSDVSLSIGSFHNKSDLLEASEQNPRSGSSLLTGLGFSDSEVMQLAKSSIHTRKFRE